MKEVRRLPVGRVPASFEGAGRAAAYAEMWLAMSGAEIARGGPPIRLWDFQVGMEGSGADACAVAGPAAAIGHGDGPGMPLPADMPEKWCGLVGAILALAEAWCGTDGGGPEYDASAADIMRAFALQNSGTPEERRRLWKRNGRICVEYGLIFPMGFFACRDGHVALLGRSRRDWRRIATALGDPEWAHRPGFDDPFALARDSAEADDNPVPAGTTGQLLLRPRVPNTYMIEYINKPEATLAAWRNLWYHSGDLGYLDEDGYVHFVGREAHWIRRRGENVSAFEVEKAITAHEAVVDCACVGVPSDLGEEDIKAYVQVSAPAEPRELVEWCRERIAYFKTPRYIEFVEDFPRTMTKNEIARHELRERGIGACWDAESDRTV